MHSSSTTLRSLSIITHNHNTTSCSIIRCLGTMNCEEIELAIEVEFEVEEALEEAED
jgi:hypothetical protein